MRRRTITTLAACTAALALAAAPAVAVERTAVDGYAGAGTPTATAIFTVPPLPPTRPTVQVVYLEEGTWSVPEEDLVPTIGRTYSWQVQVDDGSWTDLVAAEPIDREFGWPFRATVRPAGDIAVPSTEGVRAVRLHAPATLYEPEWSSTPSRIAFQHEATYQAQRDESVAMMAEWCAPGSVDVFVNAPRQEGDPDVAGLVAASRFGFPDIFVMEDPSSDEEVRRNVALHECAHVLQHRVQAVRDVDWDVFDARMLEIYGGYDEPSSVTVTDTRPGVERNAQCMAYLMGSQIDEQSYIDRVECTGEREAAARAILDGRMP